MTNPWQGLRGLPREAWLLAASILVNRAGTMVLPFLVLYLTHSLSLSPRRAAVVMAAYGIGAILTAPLAGRLADRLGPRRIVTTSQLLSGLLLLTYPLLHSYASILWMTLLWSVASEALRPASLTWMSDLVQPEKRRAAIALTRVAVNLGMSVGPAVAGFVVQVSFTAIFILDAATSLLAGALLLLTTGRSRDRASPTDAAPGVAAPGGPTAEAEAPRGAVPAPTVPRSTRTRATASKAVAPGREGGAEAQVAAGAIEGEAAPTTRPAYRDPKFMFFLVGIFPVAIVFFQHHSMLPLFVVRDLGLRESSYGLLFTLNTLLVICIEVPLVAALSSRSYRATLSLGSLLVGAGFGALILARGFAGVAATVVVWTFGEMIFLPCSMAYAAEAAPPGRRGEYIGLYSMCFSAAFALAPWLGVRVMEGLGARSLWIATFLAGLLSAVLLLRVREQPHGRRDAAVL